MLDLSDKFSNDKVLIFRDHLALERTKLANVRTLFSYIRTSLYLLTAGTGILQIKSIARLYLLAWICIIAGIILFVLGLTQYWRMKKYLKRYENKSQEYKKESINMQT